jgi:lipoate-protein ligase B
VVCGPGWRWDRSIDCQGEPIFQFDPSTALRYPYHAGSEGAGASSGKVKSSDSIEVRKRLIQGLKTKLNNYKTVDCGLTCYRENYKLQKEVFSERLEGGGRDTLLVTRHEPTITMGKSGRKKDLLVSRNYLAENGVDFVELDRGGGITYHGPGQVIIYPIFDLRNYGKDLRNFVRRLGTVAKDTVEAFGPAAEFREGDEIGLWAGGEEAKKLASLGLRVKKWYTMHGLALNVSLDGAKSGLIRPCGIGGTDLASITDYADVTLEEVKGELLSRFDDEFSQGDKR